LQFKKNQYGPLGESIALRWSKEKRLFLPEAGTSSLEKRAREAKVDEAFLSGLKEILRQGRDAVAGHTSREYGPSLIVELPVVKKEGIRKKELVESMNRLLAESKIHIGLSDDMPSKAKKCLFPGAKA
jgi:hypothetical protein